MTRLTREEGNGTSHTTHPIPELASKVNAMTKRIGLPETMEAPRFIEAPQASTGWADLEPSLPRLLHRLAPVSLDDMADVALLDRSETKFVFHADRLPELLVVLQDEYRVLEIKGNRLNHYRTLYFDTPEFTLFRRHQAGGRNRYKVRSRTYLDTDMSFMEVKHKVSADRTVKSRVKTSQFVEHISPKTVDFLNTHLPANDWTLEPKLWNQYTRITLVGKRTPERVTIDLELQFVTNEGRAMGLPGLAIAEVKRDGATYDSPFIGLMRAMSIRPAGFSKYCVGVSLLYDEVKHNHFKPQLRLIGKILQGGYYVN